MPPRRRKARNHAYILSARRSLGRRVGQALEDTVNYDTFDKIALEDHMNYDIYDIYLLDNTIKTLYF